jgi:hypothetical protein
MIRSRVKKLLGMSGDPPVPSPPVIHQIQWLDAACLVTCACGHPAEILLTIDDDPEEPWAKCEKCGRCYQMFVGVTMRGSPSDPDYEVIE